MTALIKNVVASTPLFLSMGVGAIASPILYVASKLSALGVYLHETLETDTGKQITKKRAELKKAMEAMELLKQKAQAMMQAQQAAQQSGEEPGEARLANIVKNNNTTVPTGGNVFVLGKKDDSNGNQT